MGIFNLLEVYDIYIYFDLCNLMEELFLLFLLLMWEQYIYILVWVWSKFQRIKIGTKKHFSPNLPHCQHSTFPGFFFFFGGFFVFYLISWPLAFYPFFFRDLFLTRVFFFLYFNFSPSRSFF